MNERTEFLIERWRVDRQRAIGAKWTSMRYTLSAFAVIVAFAVVDGFVEPRMGGDHFWTDGWWYVSLVGTTTFVGAMTKIGAEKQRIAWSNWRRSFDALMEHWHAQQKIAQDPLSSGDEIDAAQREWMEIFYANRREVDLS